MASSPVLASELVVVSLSPNIEISAGRGVLGLHQGNTGNTSRDNSSYQPKIFTCLYYCQPADPVSGARSGIEGNALDAVKIEKPEKAKGEVTSCGMIIEI